MPKTPFAINLSRALNQISEVQRLMLLKKLDRKKQPNRLSRRMRHSTD
jgi:hypothetical protein